MIHSSIYELYDTLSAVDDGNLREVLGSVLDIADEWEFLGMALDLPQPELKAIESDKATCKQRMKTMLQAWLWGRGRDPTWQTLCRALRDKLVGRPDIAESVERTILRKHI